MPFLFMFIVVFVIVFLLNGILGAVLNIDNRGFKCWLLSSTVVAIIATTAAFVFTGY